MEKIGVGFIKLDEWAEIPEYETRGAAGCDIGIAARDEIILYPNEVRSIPTGFAIRIPTGYEGQIRSRAGMTRKGIVVANAPATIDSEHTGEIKILLLNVTEKPVRVFPKQKVAQIVFSPIVKAEFQFEK